MPGLLAHWLVPKETNNHRPKILQNSGLTALVGLFIVVQGLLRLAGTTNGIGGLVLGYASNINPSQVIDQTNQQRAGLGLGTLTHSDALSAAAAAKAAHMFANQYWAHIAPDGTSPWYFFKNAGYSYSVAGENLARDFGDTGSVITAWMNSPTHRDNIVNGKYREIGVAVVDGVLNGVETTLVVQMFGNRAQVAAATSPKAVTAPAAKPATVPVITPVPQPAPTIAPVTEENVLVQDLEISPPAAAKVRISPLTITKILATSMVAMILLVLAYDVFVIHQRKLVRLVGKNWAHFSFFGVLLIIIYISTAGQIV